MSFNDILFDSELNSDLQLTVQGDETIVHLQVTINEIIFSNKKCKMVSGYDITKVQDNIRL